MTKKIILFNAPPKSGKDLFGLKLAAYLGADVKTFKHPLKEMAAVLTGTYDLWFTDDYDKLKDTKMDECYGLTPREMLIKISEDMVKPQFGNDFFGQNLGRRITEDVTIITDSGFQEELTPLVNKFGAENILIYQLHRPGYTFKGDSRSYLSKADNPGVTFRTVESENISKTFEEITGIAKWFLNS